ncbi:Sialidase precursor [Limihaloglobus sulfuriphilus]|uniref:exo-alpha-sialidase n=1 Tax=Limihaloglobus sulfuriphilus TaxID=1851148 RepID=A0A1Q2MCS7_9BACT|nr:sialidase family protein [Limihaloglobus sulfuriphilus]AQQ70495.1 Sialidase precursor [Limihaloglobus sulfuriphilus]
MKLTLELSALLVLILCCSVFADELPDVESAPLHSWFYADSGVFVEQSGQKAANYSEVGFWQDQSGNGHYLQQDNALKRPFLINALIEGNSALRFYGANGDGPRFENREFSLWTNFETSLQQPNTVFVVVNTRNVLNEYIFDGLTSSSRHYLIVGQSNNPRVWTLGANKTAYSTDVLNGNFLVHTLVYDSADSRHYINGSIQGVFDTGSGSLGGLRIGSRYSEEGFADMDLAELIIYNGAVEKTDRENVEKYLMEKYGIFPHCGSYNAGFPVADLNRDCRINIFDFTFLADQWLEDTSDQAEKGALYPEISPRYTDIFWQGKDGIDTYRIPTLLKTSNGVILAIAQARKYSFADKSPTKIVLRRSYNAGESWLPAQDIVDVGNDAAMANTALLDEDTGRIWLFYVVYPQGWDDNNPIAGLTSPSTTVWTTYSDDDGASWSIARDITASVKLPEWTNYATGPGVGIQLKRGSFAGRLVVPFNSGAGNHIIYSDDHGQSWDIAGSVPVGSESQIVQLYNNNLLLNIRSGRQYGRYISQSTNNGMTWSPTYYDSTLIEPVGTGGSACQASILRYTDSSEYDCNRILFSNPASGVARQNLTVRLSYDECQSWQFSKIISPLAAGYSCLTVLPDNNIGVLYENGREYSAEKITFASFSLRWLTDNKDGI